MYANIAFLVAALSAAVSAAPLASNTVPNSALSKRSYSGDVTYYTPGLGSCGETDNDSSHIVALSKDFMKNGANPNNNPLCNRMINIKYGGKTFSAKVVDTCQACSIDSIDVSPSIFTEMTGSLTAGRLHNVQWSLA